MLYNKDKLICFVMYLYKSISAACKTGYKYRPRGTSFKVDDLSLN